MLMIYFILQHKHETNKLPAVKEQRLGQKRNEEVCGY